MKDPSCCLLTVVLVSRSAAARAQGTDNHVLHAVPAPGKVEVLWDGPRTRSATSYSMFRAANIGSGCSRQRIGRNRC